jgi:hypothetical protein
VEDGVVFIEDSGCDEGAVTATGGTPVITFGKGSVKTSGSSNVRTRLQEAAKNNVNMNATSRTIALNLFNCVHLSFLFSLL